MKTLRIAILVDTSTGWGRRIVSGVLDYTMQFGPWDVWIEPKGQDEKFSLPQDINFDGVIARVSSPEMALELKSRKIPVVNISGLIIKESDFPRVTVDWEVAAQLAEAHFSDRALTHVAYVGPLHLSHVQKHERAFEHALSKSGRTCHVYPSQTPRNPGTSWHPSQAQLIPWLQSLPKPVGIYTWGFQAGRDIISACRKADIPVPHDVAVLGGDFDELLSDACHPALSGILTPARKVGHKAASVLHNMMKGGTPPKETIFFPPEEVEERLSTETLAIEDPQTLQALTYLRNHACDGIHVDDILKEVPMARRALERRFTKLLGRSPAQEMRRVQINHARKLLTRTDLSMQEVAQACGYASYTYLGHIFKKETGISPGRYRNQTRNSNPDLP
jgi:LacI family transcriptional regulator